MKSLTLKDQLGTLTNSPTACLGTQQQQTWRSPAETRNLEIRIA